MYALARGAQSCSRSKVARIWPKIELNFLVLEVTKSTRLSVSHLRIGHDSQYLIVHAIGDIGKHPVWGVALHGNWARDAGVAGQSPVG